MFSPEEKAKDMVLSYLDYENHPQHVQWLSKPFANLARFMVDTLPQGGDRSEALRSLLRARDWAYRSLEGRGD